ncbi:ribosomal protein L7/L12 [Actinoplanes sp. CA-030573]|uniref:ribosomal protein L7/L12 n=1 Tax=Actinoplanes sp. CA-030573 TaxID=3239898 RepID=UPI003D8FC42E
MLRRAAPRVVVVLLLGTAGVLSSAVTPEWLASGLRSLIFFLVFAAFASRQWWRYVRHGKPAPWRVEHGGATALFVTGQGRDRLRVVACLREHGGLDFGEASRRVDDPARPVWDDLTRESADRLGAALVDAGATVRVSPRPSPSWARDVTGR